MKRFILAASILMPGIALAQSFDYQVSVQLKPTEKPVMTYLISNYGWSSQKVIDSTILKNGKAEFKGHLEELTPAHVFMDHEGKGFKWRRDDDVIGFFLEKGKISIKGTDSVKTAQLKAGVINRQYTQYRDQVMVYFREGAKYPIPSMQELERPEVKDSILKVLRRRGEETDSLKIVYIHQHPESYLSMVALEELAGKFIDVEFAAPLFDGLSAAVKKTPKGERFGARLAEAKEFAVGAMAPDFTQNDVNGKPVKLSAFRGQYVLVDFWASWCGPCRKENPNLVKAYHTFRDKNFTVLSVSLDMPGKKDDWLAAIKKDSLTWTHVSDLKGWKNEVATLYKIKAVPQNFLIDPNGKIVARNLRDERLHKELARILK